MGDYFDKTKLEHLEEKAQKIYQETIGEIKHKIENFSPEPIKDMLETETGTYFIISVVIILIIVFLRFVGGVLSFIFKVILLISTLSAIFFFVLYILGKG